jgi:hypothetical protein
MKARGSLRLLPMNGEQENQLEESHESVTFRFDPELEPRLYVQVRSDFLCSPHFTPGAKVLYMVLCYQAGSGVSSWPSYALLAREYGMEELELEDALKLLAEVRLITPMHAEESGQRVYVVHASPKVLPMCSLHIPEEPPKIRNERIETDTQLLVTRLGISYAAARRLAQLAAERGSSEGYVAEVVEYALNTPGINNPAGCVVELIRRNETRKRASQIPHQDPTKGLDTEKYTKGKYAFLFRPREQAAEGKGVEGVEGAADDTARGVTESNSPGDGGSAP